MYLLSWIPRLFSIIYGPFFSRSFYQRTWHIISKAITLFFDHIVSYLNGSAGVCRRFRVLHLMLKISFSPISRTRGASSLVKKHKNLHFFQCQLYRPGLRDNVLILWRSLILSVSLLSFVRFAYTFPPQFTTLIHRFSHLYSKRDSDSLISLDAQNEFIAAAGMPFPFYRW